MPDFPFGETVTLHSRTVTGQDADGNDVYGDATTTLNNVPVWPRNSSELVQGQDTQIVGLWALLPPGTKAWGVDRVTIESGVYSGRIYEVDGEPGYFHNPFTGTDPGVQVSLTRVTG